MDGQDFTGKIVVVTGAGRGLGAAFAVVLADLGAEVVMTGRNTEQVTTMAEAIGRRTGKRPRTLLFDLADPGEVTRTAKTMRDGMAHIDILINNGAQWLPGRMDEHDAYAIVGTISSGVTGTLLFTRGLIRPLEASGAGDILNIISVSGLPNAPLQGESVAFHAAKHGQAGMTEGLRQELRGRPVRVSALYPPDLVDISPLDPAAWDAPRPPSSLATNRDIVEAGLFALSRPRHVVLSSIVVDPDRGGTLPD
ncbi:MAG: SDR family oxidoreductase [Parvibaculaceae bacterium]